MKKNKQYAPDDFTEEDEAYLDDTIQEMCFGEKVEQLDSDNY